MAVDEVVRKALREGPPLGVQIFAASCAERMAQLFTGIRGGNPDRSTDVDLFVRTMDNLWNIGLGRSFSGSVNALEAFVELQPSEEGGINVPDIYAMYPVLVAKYACAYRAFGDPEDSIRCAHAALTAMGQLDNNVLQLHLFEDERVLQSKRIKIINKVASVGIDLSLVRREDQNESLKRLAVVSSRIRS
jgi:hypothetical protein